MKKENLYLSTIAPDAVHMAKENGVNLDRFPAFWTDHGCGSSFNMSSSFLTAFLVPWSAFL